MGRWYKGDVELDGSLIWKKSLSGEYWVSEYGDIVNATTGYKLQPSLNKHGYLVTAQRVSGGNGSSVHRIVYSSFLGEIPDGLCINHLDGNKANNHISNLELCTYKENTDHAYRLGLAEGKKGEDNSQAKIKEETVLAAYSMFEKGYSNDQVGSILGITSKHVSLLRNGKRWKHLYKEVNGFSISTGSLPFSVPKCAYILEVCNDESLFNKDIAERFDLDRSTVSRIRSKKTWKALFNYLDSLTTL